MLHIDLKKVLVGLAVIIIVCPALGFIWFMLTLYGGLQGTLQYLKPQPNQFDKNISDKRVIVISTINNYFNKIETAQDLTSYAISTHDECYKGHHNWKINDLYAYRCTYRITKFYGFNDDFRQKMIGFENDLINQGWIAPSYEKSPYPIKTLMEESIAYEKQHKGIYHYNGTHLVTGLPKEPYGGYDKNGYLLQINFAERDTKDLFKLGFNQNVALSSFNTFFEEKNFQNIEELFIKITKDKKYILEVSIQRDYYSD